MGAAHDVHAARLKGAGLRVTAPRLALLQAVEQAPHSTAETITVAVRERLGSVSKQAIYDVLYALTNAGLLRRVAVDVTGAQYELMPDVPDNHHHVLCRECGRLEDVPRPDDSSLEPPDTMGFVIEDTEVIYRGLCPKCQHDGNHTPVS